MTASRIKRILLFAACIPLAVELAARLFLAPPQYSHVQSAIAPFEVLPNLYRQTERGPRMHPNARLTVQDQLLSGKSYTKSTNSLGYFGPEPEKCEPNCRKLVILGDSIINQDYLPEEETTVHILRNLLNAETGQKVDVLNAAITGLSTADELLVLEELSKPYRPTHALMVVYLNDLLPSASYWVPTIPTWAIYSRYLHHIFVGFSKPRAVAGREPKPVQDFPGWGEGQSRFSEMRNNPNLAEFVQSIDQNSADVPLMWSERSWQDFKIEFQQFKEFSKNKKIIPLLAIHPVKAQVESKVIDSFPQEKMKKIADELEIPVLDLLPGLRDWYSRSGRAPFYDQCHPTTETAEEEARLLLPFVETAL